MLVFDPNLRINANEALRHAYFNEYRQQHLLSGLNHVSSNHGQASTATNNFLLPSEQQTTSTLFFQHNKQPSLGHVLNSIDLGTSSSTLLTSSSSEEQINGSLISEGDHTTRSLPLTQ